MSQQHCLFRPGGGADGGASGLPLFESSSSLRETPSLRATPSLPAAIISAAASSFELLGQAGELRSLSQQPHCLQPNMRHWLWPAAEYVSIADGCQNLLGFSVVCLPGSHAAEGGVVFSGSAVMAGFRGRLRGDAGTRDDALEGARPAGPDSSSRGGPPILSFSSLRCIISGKMPQVGAAIDFLLHMRA